MDIILKGTHNFGSPIKIEDIPAEKRIEAIKQFAEGSPALEECLITMNKMGILTDSCCKGNHFSMSSINKSIVTCGQAYISFYGDHQWEDYLSSEIINDYNVVLGNDVIRYYGINHELFFRTLTRDLLTGKKNNRQLIDNKRKKTTEALQIELEIKAYGICLMQNGFSQEQISTLLKYRIESEKIHSEIVNASDSLNKKELIGKKIKLIEEWHKVFVSYFNENNKVISSDHVK